LNKPIEVTALHRDGHEFPVELTITPIRWRDSYIFGAYLRDITDRRRAEEIHAHLAAIVESSDDAIISKTLDGVVTSWNKGAERIYGYSADEIVGRPSSILLPAHLDEEPQILERLKRGERIQHSEPIRRRKDGQDIDVSLTISPIKDASGKIIGGSMLVRDITERKRAEAQLEQRSAELEAANKELNAFAYSVAHDLRAPLRAMEGFSQALLEDYRDRLDHVGQDYARRIASAAQHLDGLIQDLLAYSHLSQAELELLPVDPTRLLKDVQVKLKTVLQERHAQVTVREPLPWVFGHDTTLGQVLQNLLSNAMKFVPPGVQPQVRVWAEERDKLVRLWVEDNGIGIAPEHQERIFRIFERLHGVETYPGTGIGLAIVRKAVERMGGRVGVESALGQGSRFWMELQNAGGPR
jgi:PAS domain S-box-containing protein